MSKYGKQGEVVWHRNASKCYWLEAFQCPLFRSKPTFAQLDVPRPVSTNDRGVVVDVNDVKGPGYEVEFFSADNYTVDLLTLTEDEIEPYK